MTGVAAVSAAVTIAVIVARPTAQRSSGPRSFSRSVPPASAPTVVRASAPMVREPSIEVNAGHAAMCVGIQRLETVNRPAFPGGSIS